MKKINLSSWHRKEHFQFFSQCEDPFFGMVSEIRCTGALQYCKEQKQSFFAMYLHKALLAMNEIEEFRCRIVDNEIIEYDVIHVSSTIGREDGSFGFSFIPYHKDFQLFEKNLSIEKEKIISTQGLCVSPNASRPDVVRASAIPWCKFTGITHPRFFVSSDSVPKIVFGKAYESNNEMMMPVSVEAHHGLLDGYHIAKFLSIFEQYMMPKPKI
jgi:chloramphenicol O-acetyltransferase type A